MWFLTALWGFFFFPFFFFSLNQKLLAKTQTTRQESPHLLTSSLPLLNQRKKNGEKRKKRDKGIRMPFCEKCGLFFKTDACACTLVGVSPFFLVPFLTFVSGW
jgi:hypothetical protein